MSLTTKQRLHKAVQRIVRAEVNAEVNGSWRGDTHPEEYDQIERELELFERELELAWRYYQKLVDALIPESKP